MSSSIGRRGWESFPDTEDVALDSSTDPTHNSSHEALTEVNQQLIWCNFIAQLQRAGLKGLRNSVPGLGDPISSGTYFAVWRHRISYSGEAHAFEDQDGKVLPRGTVVALKRVIPRLDPITEKVDLDNSKLLRALSLEVQALRIPELRRHQNIVQMYCLNWESRGSATTAWPTLVLEYCEFNLSEYQNSRHLSLDEKLRIGTEIGSGLSALHSVRIVHGDIKSENILMKIQDAGGAVPKLADFGSSLLDLRFNQVDAKKSVWIGGTNPWRAPECFESGGLVIADRALATDMYSLGLLWWRILFDDKDPFLLLLKINDNDAKEALKRTDELAVQAFESILSLSRGHPGIQDVAETVCAILQVNPTSRIAALADLAARNVSTRIGLGTFPEVDTKRSKVVDFSSWHGVIVEDTDKFNTLRVREMRRLEILYEEQQLSDATKERIFQELFRVHEVANKTQVVCPGCCMLSQFDKEPVQRSPNLNLDYYFQMSALETSHHICQANGSSTSPLRADGGESLKMPELLGGGWSGNQGSLQLFTCYVEGYGVKADLGKALQCFVDCAERGIIGIQNELAYFFTTCGHPWPNRLPLRKWMMNAIVFGNYGGSATLLRSLDPKLFEIAIHARRRLFDGVSFMTGVVSLEPNEAEKEGGYTVLHKAAGAYDESKSTIRRYCDSSSYTPLRWLLSPNKPVYEVNFPAKNGDTPLLVACRAQRRDSIRLLLQLGADVSRSNNQGQTPLHWIALLSDCKDLITEMVSRGTNINAMSGLAMMNMAWILGGFSSIQVTGHVQGTPLRWATVAGNAEAVQQLIDLGADPDLAVPATGSPLEVAVMQGRSEIVQILLRKRPPGYTIPGMVFMRLITDLCLTTQYLEQRTDASHAKVAKLLSPFCPKSNLDEALEFFRWPVHLAIKGAPLILLKEMLHCLDVSFTSCGSIPGKPLSEQGWEDNNLGEVAIKRNDPQVLQLVLEMGVKSDQELLHELGRHGGRLECIDILLKHGVKVDGLYQEEPFMPFSFAVINGHVDTARALAERMTPSQLSDALSPNGSMKMRNGRLFTLFGAAIFLRRYYNDPENNGLKYLFSLPAPLNAANFVVESQNCFTAFHLALDSFNLDEGFFNEFTNLKLFRLLLLKFPEPHHINARDISGHAPLHLAVWMAKLEECQLLVDAGAEVNTENGDGHTPLDCAFLPPPRDMMKSNDNFGPTREMIRRFETKRNACAIYLRSNGGRSSHLEISRGSSMYPFILPFMEREKESRRQVDYHTSTIRR